MITRVNGTQDILDTTLLNFVVDTIKKHLRLYAFDEVQVPILEPLDLFVRSLGTYTDVVSKEMFVIDPAISTEKMCLRPELTASIVRAFVQGNVQQVPWKVFSHGPAFRHERPQKGRYRQFSHISIEIIGTESISHDVHLIVMLDRLFHEQLLLDNYVLKINFLGCTHDRVTYKEVLNRFLYQQSDLCGMCIKRTTTNTLRIFDCKNKGCQAIYRTAPAITDHLCNACDKEFELLQQQLHALSVSYLHDTTLVRGLDYYDKTIFEFASDNLGAQKTFCGGGHYDTLISQISDQKDRPCIGAAIGIERLLLLLEPQQTTLPIPEKVSLIALLPFSEQQHVLALLLADELLARGKCVDIIFEGSVKSMMRKANKSGCTHAVLLGSQEQETNTIVIKNMQTGTQETIAQSAMANFFCT
jgi:histidyl-tRNA synthetase